LKILWYILHLWSLLLNNDKKSNWYSTPVSGLLSEQQQTPVGFRVVLKVHDCDSQKITELVRLYISGFWKFCNFFWIINDLLTASSLLVLSSRLPVVWGFSNNPKL
jgi:hypothetical protein